MLTVRQTDMQTDRRQSEWFTHASTLHRSMEVNVSYHLTNQLQ